MVKVGHVNKHIRDMLTGFGFGKYEVQAVALSPSKEKPNEMEKVYGRLKTKETEKTTTCWNLGFPVQMRNILMFSSFYGPLAPAERVLPK